jgi:hypothetical protein
MGLLNPLSKADTAVIAFFQCRNDIIGVRSLYLEPKFHSPYRQQSLILDPICQSAAVEPLVPQIGWGDGCPREVTVRGKSLLDCEIVLEAVFEGCNCEAIQPVQQA